MEFRALRADEVECRIGQVAKSGKGLSLLLYKTARTDMAVLDEAVGAENWQSAALTSVIIAVAIYPLLAFFENASWYGNLFVQKSP